MDGSSCPTYSHQSGRLILACLMLVQTGRVKLSRVGLFKCMSKTQPVIKFSIFLHFMQRIMQVWTSLKSCSWHWLLQMYNDGTQFLWRLWQLPRYHYYHHHNSNNYAITITRYYQKFNILLFVCTPRAPFW